MDTSKPDAKPVAPQTKPAGTSPTGSRNRADRLEEYREQSLQKADALAANLALINSDLMAFAEGNAALVSPPSSLDVSPEALQRFERQANLQLRLVRQIDRLARIGHELETQTATVSRPRQNRPVDTKAKN